MKLRNFLMMALLFAGVTFIYGCGDDAPAAATSAQTQSKTMNPQYASAIQKEVSLDGITYEKEIKVTDSYVVICGYEGKMKASFHLVKENGEWTCKDAENDWEIKDEYR